MNIQSFGHGLIASAGAAIATAGFVGTVLGVTYIVHCSKKANTIEQLQNCYAFGGAMAGVGAGVSGIKSSGFEKGFATYNPALRGPEPTTRRRGRQDPAEPEDGGRPS